MIFLKLCFLRKEARKKITINYCCHKYVFYFILLKNKKFLNNYVQE